MALNIPWADWLATKGVTEIPSTKVLDDAMKVDEADVDHVRDVMERLLAEILEIDRISGSRPKRPEFKEWRARVLQAKVVRMGEYKRLKRAVQDWTARRNMALAHTEAAHHKSVLWHASTRAIEHLNRRRAEQPAAWAAFADDELCEALDDILDHLTSMSNDYEPAESEWFGRDEHPAARSGGS